MVECLIWEKWPLVWVSLEAPYCVLMQDTVYPIKYWLNPGNVLKWLKISWLAWADPEGGLQLVRTPLKDKKKTVFLVILVRIPWKISKLLGQNSMLGHLRDASETPFNWRFAGRSMMARFALEFWSSLLSSTKKTLSKLDPLWQRFLDPRMTGM